MNKTAQQSYVRRYITGIDNIFSENTFYRYLVFGLVLIVFYQAYLLQYSFEQRKTIILPSSTVRYTIGTHSADKEYLAAMATTVIDLYLDINAANIADKYSQLLKMFAGDRFSHYKDFLQSKASDLHEYSTISYSAALDGSQKLVITDKEIRVPVSIKKYVGIEMSSRKTHQLIIGYRIVGGRFMLTSLSEVNYEKTQ
jgi:hypothetical protein